MTSHKTNTDIYNYVMLFHNFMGFQDILSTDFVYLL